MAFLPLTVISVLLLLPWSPVRGNERVVRLVANMKQSIAQLHEDSEVHRRELNDLFTQKTDELKYLITQQEETLSALPSEIIHTMKEEAEDEAEEETEVDSARGSTGSTSSGGACPLQKAMLALFQDNPNNITEELASRLDAEMGCKADAARINEVHEEKDENCKVVPIDPNETVKLFKIKARGLGVCTNAGPVEGLNKCQGGCQSTSQYTDGGRRMRIVTTCSCCQPARFEKISVQMTCKNDNTFSKNFDNIAACRCLRCGGEVAGEGEEGA